jgi:hypothetical protein
MGPVLRQGVADFRFRMVSGAMMNAGWDGYPAIGRALSGLAEYSLRLYDGYGSGARRIDLYWGIPSL